MNILNRVFKKYFYNIDLKNIKIKNVCMNSKDIQKGSLFIAINGGNNFIYEAIERGAEYVVHDRDTNIENSKLIRVENSIKFLQEFAKMYRENLDIKIISITGSEGKTTTKDIVYGILSNKYKTKKTDGNYNNQIGLPFTILKLKEEDKIAVLEMGMSNLGEIDLLGKIAKPDYAIITNIGDSHLEYLKNRDNVFIAKTEILKYVSKENVVIYGDDEYLNKLNNVKVGFKNDNEYVISKAKLEFDGSEFYLNKEKYEVNLNGIHNIINSSLAIVIAKMFKLTYSEIKKYLKNIEITAMRFEKIERTDILYINDAYNASPESIKVALKTFDSLPIDRKKIIVLADALELGENEIEYTKNILIDALRYDFYKIFLYGKLMKKASGMLSNSKLYHFDNKNDIIEELKKLKNITVLLKGSRGMKLEEIIF